MTRQWQVPCAGDSDVRGGTPHASFDSPRGTSPPGRQHRQAPPGTQATKAARAADGGGPNRLAGPLAAAADWFAGLDLQQKAYVVVCGCLAAAVVPKAAALALVLVERLAIGALIGLENGLARVAAIAGALGAAVLLSLIHI